mmetsp:Transcript_7839/g.11365  ORF Transcript_7839/g.11365 Transcript_7839/m.11365 type:complete len:451 (-) Transcript_7839:339-1691(-)
MNQAANKRLLNAFWMPFTANRHFKSNHDLYMLASAKGNYYFAEDGRKIFDATSGLWCSGLGHCHPKITEAISQQASTLDYAPTFQMGHPKAFEFANRIIEDLLPSSTMIKNVFFTSSGSSAVDSALKICLAYHYAKGEGNRTRFVGRELGYHGVGFGGISVGGLGSNRKAYGSTLFGADHLPHTLNINRNAFTKGMPQSGVELADSLRNLITLHSAENIAAVIVEPVAGSAGVIVPPVGYLKRLREICDQHNLLLIFDEVITGVGRLGTGFGTEFFDVQPDIITTAKGLTNGAVPCGAVLCKGEIYDTITSSNKGSGRSSIELFHGYTYSGHPLAMAAGLATLDIIKEENVFENVRKLSAVWEDGLHSLKDSSNLIKDIRNIGLMGAITFESIPDDIGHRAHTIQTNCLRNGLLVRVTGDTIAMSPPLVSSERDIGQIIEILGKVFNDLQ